MSNTDNRPPFAEATDADIDMALKICDDIAPLLAGKGPTIQSAVLAQLTATWVCGFYPLDARRVVLHGHVVGLRILVDEMTQQETAR